LTLLFVIVPIVVGDIIDEPEKNDNNTNYNNNDNNEENIYEEIKKIVRKNGKQYDKFRTNISPSKNTFLPRVTLNSTSLPIPIPIPYKTN